RQREAGSGDILHPASPPLHNAMTYEKRAEPFFDRINRIHRINVSFSERVYSSLHFDLSWTEMQE
ncbi:MAG: hypothetical protein O7F70_05855, partial [Gemmatimonadetes bacterium]|nr:hypothetical protein [Gemmatimonadota bacterium]